MNIPAYPHSETIESMIKMLETSKQGLEHSKAQANLLLYGRNEIEEEKHNY